MADTATPQRRLLDMHVSEGPERTVYEWWEVKTSRGTHMERTTRPAPSHADLLRSVAEAAQKAATPNAAGAIDEEKIRAEVRSAFEMAGMIKPDAGTDAPQ